MKMPSHVLRLMCHCDCVIIAPGSPQAQCLQALINQSTIDRPLYRECKSTCKQKSGKNTDRKHKLAKHSGLPSDMKSVQGSKILADVRTDSFHSGPLTDPDPNHRGSLSVSRGALYAPDEIWDESLCQHKSPAKPDLEAGLGRQHTYTPSTCHSEDADSPVLHALFSALLQRDFRHSQGWGTWVWPRDKLV